AVHVRYQRLRNSDASVGLLVVFENCEIGAADGETAAVEGMEELALLRSRRAIANVRAAGLEGLEVRAGGDLAIELLTGEPDFEVVGPGRGEAQVSRAEEHAAVGKAEPLEDGLGVAGQQLVLGGRVLRL